MVISKLYDQLLIRGGTDPRACDEDGVTPLHVAAQNGHLEVVRLLVERGADPQTYNHDGETPLYGAVYNSHLKVVQLLVERGADPHKVCDPPKEDLTAFVFAATADDAKWQSYLGTKAGLALKTDQFTGLHLAARLGFPDIVQRMVNAGAPVDVRDERGQTPLILASKNAHASTVEMLLKLRANANLSDTVYDQTALSWAAEIGHTEVVKLLCPKSNINTHASRWRNHTALTLAAMHGHTSCVKALIEAKANLDAADEDGHSPLACAARGGHRDIYYYGLVRSWGEPLPRVYREENPHLLCHGVP